LVHDKTTYYFYKQFCLNANAKNLNDNNNNDNNGNNAFVPSVAGVLYRFCFPKEQ